MKNLDTFISATIDANIELKKEIVKKSSVYYKSGEVGAGGDVSIGLDVVAEKIFIKHLQSFGQIDSEECGVVGEGACKITLDPIDGSDNFKSNFPYFGSSVALELDGDVKIGIVTNLADDTLFLKTKQKFQSTKLNKIKFIDIKSNPYASVGIFERAYTSKKYAKKLKNSCYKYRTPGATALSLAYTNQVVFFVYEGEMRSYDIRAGMFMCEGLYQHKEKDLTIICQELNHFENLKKLLL